jgi:hypothetical protein
MFAKKITFVLKLLFEWMDGRDQVQSSEGSRPRNALEFGKEHGAEANRQHYQPSRASGNLERASWT